MELEDQLRRRGSSAYWVARNGQTILRRPPEAKALWRTIRERRELAAGTQPMRPRPRILVYHAVDRPELFVNSIGSRRLRRQLLLAREEGYRFVSLDELATASDHDAVLAVTFDDGYRSVLDVASTFAELGVPWTMFVTSSWAGGAAWRPELYLSWAELAALADSGVGIGSHSATHPDFGRLDRDTARAELESSRRAIREHLGIDVSELAIPIGNAANWSSHAHEVALELGYTRIYAQSEELRFPGTIGRSFVSGFDGDRAFLAVLRGAFDRWEEPAA